MILVWWEKKEYQWWWVYWRFGCGHGSGGWLGRGELGVGSWLLVNAAVEEVMMVGKGFLWRLDMK